MAETLRDTSIPRRDGAGTAPAAPVRGAAGTVP